MKNLAFLLAPFVVLGGLGLLVKFVPEEHLVTCKVTPVNINTATALEIARIPKIDLTLADTIIKARPFQDGADLVRKVKGFGSKKMIRFGSCFLYK